MSLAQARIVLIETHTAGNLGAVARCMGNFGLADLVLVAPIANRHDANARHMATHGEAILDAARVVPTLDDAIADCVLVVGTSAKAGGLFRRQPVAPPDVVMPRVAEFLRRDQPVAIVFGPEPTGLSNAIVARCQTLIQIPTDETYAALNLAQSVAICLYELRKAWCSGIEHTPSEEYRRAPLEMFDPMVRHLQTALEEIHFLYGEKAESLMHALRHLLGKAELSEMEVRILHGLARQIRWYVAENSI